MDIEAVQQAALKHRPGWSLFTMNPVEIPAPLPYAATSNAWTVVVTKQFREYEGPPESVSAEWLPAEWTGNIFEMYLVISASGCIHTFQAKRQDEPRRSGLGFAVDFPNSLD